MEQITESIKQGQQTRIQVVKHAKQFSLAILSVGLLALDWWLIKGAMFDGQPASFWVWPISVTALWIAVVSFFALVNPNRLTFFIVNALGLVSFLLIMPKDIFIFLGGVVFFVLSMMFQRRLESEERNQLNFSIRRTMGNSQMIMTYALLVLIGFVVYSNVRSDFLADRDLFYTKLSETAVKGVPFLSQDKAKYNLSQTVRDFFKKQAQDQYQEFNQVSAEQQEILLNEIEYSFRQQYGVDATGTDSLKVAMTQVVAQRLKEYLGPYEKFFPLIFTLGILALLKTFAFVFNWVVVAVTWVLFKILLVTRFFRIEKQTIEVEKLEI